MLDDGTIEVVDGAPYVIRYGVKVNPALAHLLVPVSSLLFDPKNARVHTDRNLRAIAASLDQFGYQKPIVVNYEQVILAGNGTVDSATQHLGTTVQRS